ncbi:MAG: hypothetical protein E4G94_11185 [ANME-2 cluster archaeon]|nr:MAG: hypothetical protein E4G94_11185 [ANME-2 cluster archaeon]
MVNEQVPLWTRCLVVCVIIILTLIGTATGAVTRTGLVAEWHFDGNAEDSSGNGNDGIIFGATFVDGKVGKALSFDGRSYIDIPKSSSLDINRNAVSISLWVKLNAVPSEISDNFSAGIYDSVEDSYIIYEKKTTNELIFKVTDADDTTERPGIHGS